MNKLAHLVSRWGQSNFFAGVIPTSLFSKQFFEVMNQEGDLVPEPDSRQLVFCMIALFFFFVIQPPLSKK